MNQKKLIILVAAIFSVFAVASVAFAVNRVEVKVTSEPILVGTDCAKAGGFSLEFDASTKLTSGDRMTVDLDYASSTERVTLCKSFDFVVAPVNSNVIYDSATDQWTFDLGWGNPAEPNGANTVSPANSTGTPPETGPFLFAADAPRVNSGSPAPYDRGVIFHVKGTAGDSRVTITVIGNQSNYDGQYNPATLALPNWPFIQVDNTDASNDKLILKLFDESAGDTDSDGNPFDVPGIFVDDVNNAGQTATNIMYLDYILAVDNALCINPELWDGNVFKGNMDSRNDKYTFIPSDPQIAHYGPGSIAKVSCDKSQTCGNIIIGSGSTQGSTTSTAATCTSFDNETADGYCAGTHRYNRLVIESSQPFASDGKYQVTVQILVNGSQSASQGVYFSSDLLAVGAFTDKDDACEQDATDATGSTYYYYASGQTLNDAGETPEPPHNGECDVDPDRKAVTLITDPAGQNFGVGTNNRYMFIDIPALNYDLDEIDEGDQVTVDVKLTQLPCSVLFHETHCIGTFGCDTVAADTTRQLFFPYYTEMENGGYWDGFVLENVGAADGEATITVYEQDGDIGTATINVAAHGMYVNLLSAILPDMTMTDESDGDGTLGNSRCYMVVCTDFNADGFAMMGNSGTGESMGYLPRIAPTLPGSDGDSYDLCD